MESQESRAAVRRVTWTGAVARSYGEADEIKREIESAIPAHERAEMIWS